MQIESLDEPIVDQNGQIQYFRFIEPVAGEGTLAGVSNIEINGHSLGGHLATAFARIFGGSIEISHVSTFNSAGFTLGSEAVSQGATQQGSGQQGEWFDAEDGNDQVYGGAGQSLIKIEWRDIPLLSFYHTDLLPNLVRHRLGVCG